MANVPGTNKSETLNGVDISGDTITGLGGSDIINALGGSDVIMAGDGADTVFGAGGDDLIYGHSEADVAHKSGLIRAREIADIGSGAVQTAITDADPGFIYALAKDKGVIYRINEETGKKREFLDIPDGQFDGGGERGVLGMAFHPDYADNGRFFVYLTNADGDIEVREYGPKNANPDKIVFKELVITIPHPGASNHNGGSMAFGPDGLLYLGVGDGGGSGDPDGNAQNIESRLGKILRIDVDGDDFPDNDARNYAIPDDNPFVGVAGHDEIWAVGVRNPWRMSFDPETGDLYIGDVGQNEWEEINYVAAGDLNAGGLNFGWDYFEGNDPFEGTPPGGVEFTDPVFTYSHNGGGGSVTGGVVYHGPAPGLEGAYVFSDFITGKFYTLRMVDGVAEDGVERTGQIRGADLSNISAFGTDSDGNLLAVGLDGRILRLTPGAAAGDGNDELHGGSGNDTIYGGFGSDSLFGDEDDDRLVGGAGADTLEGGTGADIFEFRKGSGRDTVADFEVAGDAHDILDLSGFAAIDSFRDLKRNHMSEDGGDVVIEVGSDRIVVENVDASDLKAAHFDLA